MPQKAATSEKPAPARGQGGPDRKASTDGVSSLSVVPVGNLSFKIPPWAHQLEAIQRAKARPHFALFFEMGAGKTSTAVNILRYKYSAARSLKPTLILCPPIVIDNWRREILAHSQIPPDRITCLLGTGRKREETLEKALAANPNRIVIANYETLLMEDVFERLYNWRPRCLVVDESHRCKAMTAKRTKRVIKIADRADGCRLILTGTPVLNTPMDLFGQYRILDGGETFGTNFFAFRARYFEDKNARMPAHVHFPNWQPRPGAIEEINKIISATGMRVEKKDCLTLPPLVKKVVTVPLAPKQQKMYDDLREDFVAYVNDKACVAQLAITKALRMQQIVSGFAVLEDDSGKRSNYAIKDNPRAETLKELLSELAPHHKVIVWAVFKENYAAIRQVCNDLELQFVEVHGDVPAKQKMDNVKRFDDDPACRVLVGHPGSGGIGVNLVAASYSIFYSRSFSLEFDLQAEARNYRGGSERHESITRIDLVAPGTIDEQVMLALADKQEIGDRLIRSMEKLL